ncbi:MAG: DHH family phosphoesterase [Candidatus Falkowbacteria bacterium]
MIISSSDFKLAEKKIIAAQNILLVTHNQPDGDGLSCLCAMNDWLMFLHKKITLYCHNKPSANFTFLPGVEKITFFDEKIGVPFADTFYLFDLILIFDCGSLSRTTLDQQLLSRKPNQFVIDFDHHPQLDQYADLTLRDASAAATTEIVYDFFITNGVELTKTRSICLMTGLVTDTANFFYPTASEKTVAIASDLISHGASLPSIHDRTFRNKTISGLKLWGLVMSRLTVNPAYNIAVSVLLEDEVKSLAVEQEELEGISGFLSNLKNVDAILLLREDGLGNIRGSLRTSRAHVDVSRLARALGGGGHAKASGFTLPGKIELINDTWRIV